MRYRWYYYNTNIKRIRFLGLQFDLTTVSVCRHKKLKKYIEEHPEAMQKDMAEHFGCVPTTVLNALKAMGYTRKKNDKIPGKR